MNKRRRAFMSIYMTAKHEHHNHNLQRGSKPVQINVHNCACKIDWAKKHCDSGQYKAFHVTSSVIWLEQWVEIIVLPDMY